MNIVKHKPSKRQMEKFLLNSLIILIGNAIAAMGAGFFIVPKDINFVMGGTTGIGILVRNLIGQYGASVSPSVTDWIVESVVWAGNIALFVVGVIFLGKKFAMGTLAGTILYPGFLMLYNLCNEAYEASMGSSIGGSLGDPFLSAVLGGALFGLGIGLVVRVGASTGGTDIPPLIFNKYFNMPVSTGLWICDGAIILLQFAAWPAVKLSEIAYGVVITIVTSLVIAAVSPIGMRRTQVKIISNHYLEIRDMILTKISRGVTVLYGQTGYLKEDCHMLLTVISHRQLVQLKSEVQKIDPEAFMTISVVSEVRGRGFHSDGVDFLMKEDPEEKALPAPQKKEEQNGEN